MVGLGFIRNELVGLVCLDVFSVCVCVCVCVVTENLYYSPLTRRNSPTAEHLCNDFTSECTFESSPLQIFKRK